VEVVGEMDYLGVFLGCCRGGSFWFNGLFTLFTVAFTTCWRVFSLIFVLVALSIRLFKEKAG
jgi:hypothetical protein